MRAAKEADVAAEPGRTRRELKKRMLQQVEKLRLLHVRKNIIYDHRGRVLVAVFRRNTPHNPLTAEQIKDVFDALTELRATHGFENIFKQDDSREWKSFHAGVWALCAFVFPKLSIRSAHALASGMCRFPARGPSAPRAAPSRPAAPGAGLAQPPSPAASPRPPLLLLAAPAPAVLLRQLLAGDLLAPMLIGLEECSGEIYLGTLNVDVEVGILALRTRMLEDLYRSCSGLGDHRGDGR